MFGFGRRTSHRQLARAELGESLGHLRQAATHAAAGIGATVGPRVDAARAHLSPAATRVRRTASDRWESTMTAIAPLAVAATEGARQAGSVARKAQSKRMRAMRKKKSMGRRWPMLTGLMIASAVAGAMGAAALRRRSRAPWEDYDPAAELDAVREDAATIMGGSAGHEPATSKPTPAEKQRDQAPAAGEKATTPTAQITEGARRGGGKGANSGGLLGSGAGAARGSGAN